MKRFLSLFNKTGSETETAPEPAPVTVPELTKKEIIEEYSEMRHINSLLVSKEETERRAKILRRYNIEYDKCQTKEEFEELKSSELEKEYQEIIKNMANEWELAFIKDKN